MADLEVFFNLNSIRPIRKIRGAGLFSGKDSLYAMYLAERYGVVITDLISLITTFDKPAGHIENISILQKIAADMNKKLTIINLQKGRDALVEALIKMGVEVLVAGDVLVEDHVRWLQEICKMAGIALIEPLFNKDTLVTLREMIDAGFKATIICVDTEFLGEEWLGFALSKETLNEFLSKKGNIDPLGENGEYHTIVIDCPLYKRSLSIKSSEMHRSGKISYITIKLNEENRDRARNIRFKAKIS